MSRARRAAAALVSPAVAAPATVLLLALLASATSLVNGFVYDDRPIILLNSRVHTLARWWEVFGQAYWPPNWGDTNYRPLTILSFAVQWAVGGGSPAVFHATNVALYLVACVAVLRLASLVLPPRAAWLVAALFAVHPVHVEAVGNVVGQAEIVVGICSALAAAAYLTMRGVGREPQGTAPASLGGRPNRGSLALIAVLFAVACFSKESGFFLPGLLLAAELTVVGARLEPHRKALWTRVREVWALYGLCAVIGLAYLAARYSVLGGFGDDPNTVVSLLGHKARILTMLGVVPEWARLLLWPARLAADYSPADVPIALAFGPELIPAAFVLIGLVVLGIAGCAGDRTAGFGMLWAAVALFPVSNLVLRSGVIVAERTLFLPSVGALLAVGAAAAWASRRASELGYSVRRLAVAVVALVLTLGVARSAARQRVWRTSDDFLRTIVEDAPRSYRAHYMHGMWLFDKGRREEGERHLRIAIAIFPYDAGPYTDLAEQYRRAELCTPARDLYRRAIALGSGRPRARLGLVACLLRDAQFAEAAAQARMGAARGGPEALEFRRLAATADSAAAATGSVKQAGARHGSAAEGKDPRL